MLFCFVFLSFRLFQQVHSTNQWVTGWATVIVTVLANKQQGALATQIAKASTAWSDQILHYLLSKRLNNSVVKTLMVLSIFCRMYVFSVFV